MRLHHSFVVISSIILGTSSLAQAGTFSAPYSSDGYTQTTFNIGLTTPDYILDMAFLPSDPNTLLYGAFTAGGIYAVHVTRDANQHITGISGTPTLYASAPGITGGLIFAPNNVLFYGQGKNIVEIKPGDTSPDKTVNLPIIDDPTLPPNLTGMAFAPNNSASLYLTTYDGELYNVTLFPDGTGTYNFSGLTPVQFIGEQIHDITLVNIPQPDINPPAYILNADPNMYLYGVDSSGVPISSSFKQFYSPTTPSDGGVFDPISGDYIFSNLGQSTQLLEIRGFGVPEPTALGILALASTTLLLRRRL